MRKLASGMMLAVVVSLFLISVAAAADTKTDTTSDTSAQPAIVMPELRHDMCGVFEQEKYTHVFKVQNAGDADLVIKNVKPG